VQVSDDDVREPVSVALMDRLLRVGEGKLLKQLSNIAKQVNAIEDDFVAMSDEELRGQTGEFRTRYENGETLESLRYVRPATGCWTNGISMSR
jgi:preprotein translocase subunit SecA